MDGRNENAPDGNLDQFQIFFAQLNFTKHARSLHAHGNFVASFLFTSGPFLSVHFHFMHLTTVPRPCLDSPFWDWRRFRNMFLIGFDALPFLFSPLSSSFLASSLVISGPSPALPLASFPPPCLPPPLSLLPCVAWACRWGGYYCTANFDYFLPGSAIRRGLHRLDHCFFSASGLLPYSSFIATECWVHDGVATTHALSFSGRRHQYG